MKYVKKTLVLVGFVVALGVFGLVGGTAVQHTFVPESVEAYCEQDLCEELDGQCFDTAGSVDYNCNMTSTGCEDMPCRHAIIE